MQSPYGDKHDWRRQPQLSFAWSSPYDARSLNSVNPPCKGGGVPHGEQSMKEGRFAWQILCTKLDMTRRGD